MNLGITLVSALVLGVSGSAHCAVMCGPVSTVLGGTSGGGASRTVATQLGRASTYVALGVLFGAVGARLSRHLAFSAVSFGSRVLVAVTLILAGAHLAGVTSFASRLMPSFRRFERWSGSLTFGLSSSSLALAYARGLMWGFLPCGLVYAAATLAAASGSAVSGGLVMATFAASTLPVFALLFILSTRAIALFRNGLVRRTAGLVLVLAGVVHLSVMARERGLVGLGRERPCCAARH